MSTRINLFKVFEEKYKSFFPTNHLFPSPYQDHLNCLLDPKTHSMASCIWLSCEIVNIVLSLGYRLILDRREIPCIVLSKQFGWKCGFFAVGLGILEV